MNSPMNFLVCPMTHPRIKNSANFFRCQIKQKKFQSSKSSLKWAISILNLFQEKLVSGSTTGFSVLWDVWLTTIQPQAIP